VTRWELFLRKFDMAKRKVNKARDFRTDKMNLGDGFVIDTKCRVVGLQYLEDVYDKPIDKINFGPGRIRDTVHLLTALALGTYPDMSVDDIKKKIGQLDAAQLGKIAEAGDIFSVQSKNSEAPPKGSKVKGNLTETS